MDFYDESCSIFKYYLWRAIEDLGAKTAQVLNQHLCENKEKCFGFCNKVATYI